MMGSCQSPHIVSAQALAHLLAVSEPTIRDLAARYIVKKVGKGRYDLAESVRRYCADLREVAAARGMDGATGELTASRAREAKEQADNLALRNAALRGERSRRGGRAGMVGGAARREGGHAGSAEPSSVAAAPPHLS
jgi:phage terminase Nu1 subunit (DNA packaging protein)